MGIPDFTRTQWVSPAARDRWESIIQRISMEAARVEVETIKKGLRDVALVSIRPEHLDLLVKGMGFAVIGVAQRPTDFASRVVAPGPNDPVDLRVVIGPQNWVDLFREANADGDTETVGSLLGYPPCCVQHFKLLWDECGIIDFTWDNARINTNQTRAVVVPWGETNFLWTRLGVRAFYHVPCSYRCQATYDLVRTYKKLWDPNLWSFYEEMTNWSVEFSMLHGAAELRTPILKVVHNTEYTSSERVLQFVGTSRPDETPKIDAFPYNMKHNIAYNNGFRSIEQMNRAQEPIVSLALHGLDGVKRIYDPGCGNGHLLEKLSLNPSCHLEGCDINENAILEGRLLGHNAHIEHKDMFDVKFPSADLVVLTTARLAEVKEDKARSYLSRLNYRYLILYAYADNSDSFWGLKDKYFGKKEPVATAIGDASVAILLTR